MSRRTKELFREKKITELVQITEEDVRFYHDEANDLYYPSVTTVLECLPKDDFLEQWKDKNGAEAVNQLLYTASKSGTAVHDAIDQMCTNILLYGTASLDWVDETTGYKKYKTHEWEGIVRFVDFYTNHVEAVLLSESRLHSVNLFVSGTVDNVFLLKDGRKALVDTKFANNLNDKYSIQTWAYKEMFEEIYGEKIDVRGNLWLKSAKRGADKAGKKIQGKGWEFVEHPEESRDSKMFKCAHDIFLDKWRKKEIVPSIKRYPASVTITKSV